MHARACTLLLLTSGDTGRTKETKRRMDSCFNTVRMTTVLSSYLPLPMVEVTSGVR
jgi:hypothetical protein